MHDCPDCGATYKTYGQLCQHRYRRHDVPRPITNFSKPKPPRSSDAPSTVVRRGPSALAQGNLTHEDIFALAWQKISPAGWEAYRERVFAQFTIWNPDAMQPQLHRVPRTPCTLRATAVVYLYNAVGFINGSRKIGMLADRLRDDEFEELIEALVDLPAVEPERWTRRSALPRRLVEEGIQFKPGFSGRTG